MSPYATASWTVIGIVFVFILAFISGGGVGKHLEQKLLCNSRCAPEALLTIVGQVCICDNKRADLTK